MHSVSSSNWTNFNTDKFDTDFYIIFNYININLLYENKNSNKRKEFAHIMDVKIDRKQSVGGWWWHKHRMKRRLQSVNLTFSKKNYDVKLRKIRKQKDINKIVVGNNIRNIIKESNNVKNVK